MKIKLFKCVGGVLPILLLPLAILSFVVVGCGDSEVAGGVTEDAGIVADISGVFQKGPFVEGTPVKVTGVDCKTLEPRGEIAEGFVANSRGEFNFAKLTLSTSCAIFEATGYYLNELTGERTADKFTLRAVTRLTDRNSVNVNLFTHMEYGRVVRLVTAKGMDFDDAKEQAEAEVLAAFGITGELEEFEDMNIAEPGDGNAALLAVSVMMQADGGVAELAERLDKFDDAFVAAGSWDDSETKKAMTGWARMAEANGEFDAIRRNVESWSEGGVAPTFESVVDEIVEEVSRNPYLNPEVEYGTLVDARDGHAYAMLKIGGQTWMAENLDYFDTVAVPGLKDSSWCYDNNPAKCVEAGRLYTWSVARVAVCPDGWHLPDTTEWNALVAAAGGSAAAASALKSAAGWDSGAGTNGTGFSAVAVGERYRSGSFDSEGLKAYLWSADNDSEDRESAYGILVGSDDSVTLKAFPLANGFAVRCVMD